MLEGFDDLLRVNDLQLSSRRSKSGACVASSVVQLLRAQLTRRIEEIQTLCSELTDAKADAAARGRELDDDLAVLRKQVFFEESVARQHDAELEEQAAFEHASLEARLAGQSEESMKFADELVRAKAEIQNLEIVANSFRASDSELLAELLQGFGGLLRANGHSSDMVGMAALSPRGSPRNSPKGSKTRMGITAASMVTRSLHAELVEHKARTEVLSQELAGMQDSAASQAAKLQEELCEARCAAAASEGRLAAHQATVQRGSCELQQALRLAVAEFSSRVAFGDAGEGSCVTTADINTEAG